MNTENFETAEETTSGSDYDGQARSFLADTGSILSWEFQKFDFYFSGDREKRLIWKFTITRGSRSYSSTFAESIAGSFSAIMGKPYPFRDRLTVFDQEEYLSRASRIKTNPETGKGMIPKNFGKYGFTKGIEIQPPKAYDLLACLEKTEPDENRDQWARDLGYGLRENKTSISEIKRLHKACRDQWIGLCRLYNDQEMDRLAEIN